MFPLTHIAVAQKTLNKENTMTVLGSVFPDFVAYLGLGRNLGHELGRDLYYYCLANFPQCLDFALGVLTHGNSLPGIDFYADEEYDNKRPGFCFQQGKALISDIERYCNVPASMAPWKSHNFIEIAFDVLTANRDKTLQQRAEKHIFQEDIPVIDMLHSYLKLPQKEILEMFRVVPKQFCFNGNDTELMTEKFLLSLRNRHGITGGNLKDAVKITEKSIAIVTPLYDSFMNNALGKIKESLSELPTAPVTEPPLK